MALIDVGNDPWIQEYEACEKLYNLITEQISQRDANDESSMSYDALSAKIRLRLKQFSGEVKELSEKLSLASVISSITDEEKERRRHQIEYLQARDIQLNEQFNERSKYQRGSTQMRPTMFPKQLDRRAVLADCGISSWADMDEAEPEETRSRTTMNLREEQNQIKKTQDEGLEVLSQIISRQKQISTSINAEVTEQNEILVDISDNMDRMDSRIRSETDMVKVIGKKDTTWGYWVVILLLFVAILGVSFA